MRLGSFMSRFTFMDNGFDTIKASFPQHDYIMDPEAALEALPTLDGILVDRIDRSLLDQAVSLKALFTSFTGINHLPIDLLRERGVKVINIHCQAPEVAQCALAMALAFYGRVVEYHNALRATRWHGFWAGHATDDRWTSLFRRPCAIFGTGAIGTALARLLKAFECPVTGYRRHADTQIPPHFDRMETDLAKAVEEAELLFIALPLTQSTRGLFTKDLLLSARGKFLVNVGRGEIVDEEGLYLALKNGVLKGAAIDTWYTYPQSGSREGAPSRFPIHTLPNVILSPHIAGNTVDGCARIADQVLENIAEWLTTGRCSREANLVEMY